MTIIKNLNYFKKQQGAALILLFLALAATGAVFLIATSGPNNDRVNSANDTAASLAKAKEVLLAYSTSFYLRETSTSAISYAGLHGLLPCPESTTGTHGKDPGSCAVINSSFLGRLPWLELEIEPLIDGSGECLWYAVSGSFFKDPRSPMINDDTPGQFQIYNQNGLLSIGSTPEDRVVAVIIAPGKTLSGQTRANAATGIQCKVPNNLLVTSNYLESYQNVSNSSVNTNTSDLLEQFINSTGLDDNTNLNDRIITITAKEIFDRIKTNDSIYINKIDEMANTLADCLIDYSEEANFALTPPLPTPPGGGNGNPPPPNQQASCRNQCRSIRDSCLQLADSGSERAACNATRRSCTASCGSTGNGGGNNGGGNNDNGNGNGNNGGGNNGNGNGNGNNGGGNNGNGNGNGNNGGGNNGNGNPNPVGGGGSSYLHLPWPAPVNLADDYRVDNNYADVDSGTSAMAMGRLPFTTSISEAAMGISGVSTIFDACGIDPDSDLDEMGRLWKNWKDHWFYVVGDDFLPSTNATPTAATCTNCPIENSSGNAYAALLIFSGERNESANQLRQDPFIEVGAAAGNLKSELNNYLEGSNISGGNLFNDNLAEPLYNDRVYCLSATTSEITRSYTIDSNNNITCN